MFWIYTLYQGSVSKVRMNPRLTELGFILFWKHCRSRSDGCLQCNQIVSILIHANNGMLQVKRIKSGEECSTWKYSAWHVLINIMSSKTYHLLKSAVFQFCRFSSFLLVIQVSGLLWRWLSGYLHINSLPFLEALYPSSEEKKNF